MKSLILREVSCCLTANKLVVHWHNPLIQGLSINLKLFFILRDRMNIFPLLCEGRNLGCAIIKLLRKVLMDFLLNINRIQ